MFFIEIVDTSRSRTS